MIVSKSLVIICVSYGILKYLQKDFCDIRTYFCIGVLVYFILLSFLNIQGVGFEGYSMFEVYFLDRDVLNRVR